MYQIAPSTIIAVSIACFHQLRATIYLNTQRLKRSRSAMRRQEPHRSIGSMHSTCSSSWMQLACQVRHHVCVIILCMQTGANCSRHLSSADDCCFVSDASRASIMAVLQAYQQLATAMLQPGGIDASQSAISTARLQGVRAAVSALEAPAADHAVL